MPLRQMSQSRQAKILQLTAIDLTIWYFLLPLLERLRSEGCEVQIACSPGRHLSDLKAKGYRVHSIKIARRTFSWSHPRALWQLYRLMKRERFDIVHVHTPVASALGRLAARWAGASLIFYTSHGFYLPEGKPRWRRHIYLAIERLLGRRFTDYLFTVSDEDRELAVHEAIISADRVLWTHGVGVDTAYYGRPLSEPARQSLRHSLGLEPNDQVIGFIGRLVHEKGIEELLRALVRVRECFSDAKLLLIGETLASDRDQGMRSQIEGLIRDSRLESAVRLTGFREDIPQLLAVMDLFALPSHREGMPRSILEAMAAGRPVVATNIRGCREEIVDGVTGLLVPVGDVDQLAQAICKLLSNRELARRMGDAGQERVQALFEERTVLERQVEIYRKFLVKRGLWPDGSS